MSDNTCSGLKSTAALTSPKIVKNSKGTILPTTQLAHVQYGCEHMQLLLENARIKTLKEYTRILLAIFEGPRLITSTYLDSEGQPAATMGPLYMCLQCSLICPAAERNSHVEAKGHVFSVQSRTGNVYCGHCRDIIYDPTLVARLDLKGKKPRKEEVLEEDHILTINNTTFPPCRAVGLRGLYNMGNTCFMSVVLQTLIHNPFLNAFYLGEGHKKDDCDKGGAPTRCVSCALDEMFVEFYSQEKTEGYGAVNMLMASWLSGEALAGYEQQDAHEYLQFMLNTLHLQNGGSHEDGCNCIIHQVFYGKLCSIVTCDKCKYTNKKVEPYMDLSLEVHNQGKKRKHDSTAEGTGLTLRDCLERFTSREKLAAEDYTCPGCNEKRNATKQLSIESLPNVLSIHLKRFEHTGSASTKIETEIGFPMQLDLYPYTTHYKSTQTDSSSNQRRSADLPVFELSGVIVHKGGMDSGHYVNFSREGPNWFMFDDSKVVLASEADVLGAEAYILFYTVSEIKA